MIRPVVSPPQILLVLMCGLTVLAASLVRRFLPERFLLDEDHLRRVIADPGVTPEDTSFHTVAALYQALGLDRLDFVALTLPLVVLVACIFQAAGFEEWNRLGIVGFVAAGLALGLGLVYLAQYSKEFLSLLVAFGVLVAAGFRRGSATFVGIVGVCVLYGTTVRPYWLLIAVLVPVAALTLRRVRNPLVLLGGVFVVYLVLSQAFGIAFGDSLNATREWVNEGRVGTDVATTISAPQLGASPVAEALAALVVFVQLIVPVPLLTGGDLYYRASGLVIVFVWAVVVAAIMRNRCRQDSRSAWVAALLISLVVVQGVFEPDYGSYLKHLTPFIALVLVLAPRADRRASAVPPPDGGAPRATGSTPTKEAVR
jgi:hypothetical protein